jgi:phytoene synthase
MTRLDLDSELQSDRSFCRTRSFSTAKTFRYAFKLLPEPEQTDMCVIYAWCRRVDDIADDEGLSEAERATGLAAEDALLQNIGDRSRANDPVHRALAELVARRKIPIQDLSDLVAGMRQDLTTHRYASFAELHEYCYLAASTVGLLCLSVFGFEGGEARALAADMGIALQLTNVLRDVREDLERGRIYLPQDELQNYGITEDELAAPCASPKVLEYFRFFAARAERYFERSVALLPLIPPRTRLCPRAIHGLYYRILREIAACGYDVLQHRVKLASSTKFSLAGRLWLATRLGY